MNKIDLQEWTKKFVLQTFTYAEALPNSRRVSNLVYQPERSPSSVGANYRSACRGKSKADFIAKLGIVEEEADESMFWIELLEELGFKNDASSRLRDEANQLVSIIVSACKTARTTL